MKPSDKKRVIEFYDERVATHGHSPLSLGWNKRRHELRYDVLLGQWDLDGRSVLDFGCGFGDMYGYMRKRSIDADYLGVDLNARLIEEGRRAHPEARLECRDLLSDGAGGRYDYALSSGVHNFKLEAPGENDEFTRATFELFDGCCRMGFALNFLSTMVDHRVEHLHYSDPCAILALAYRYSRRVTLRNDYMPWEFTVFVDKRTDFDPELGVYPEYEHLLAT